MRYIFNKFYFSSLIIKYQICNIFLLFCTTVYIRKKFFLKHLDPVGIGKNYGHIFVEKKCIIPSSIKYFYFSKSLSSIKIYCIRIKFVGEMKWKIQTDKRTV